MPIQALGAGPNMMLHPAQQIREEVVSRDVNAGNTTVTPGSEKMSDQETPNDQAGLGMQGSTQLQEMFNRFKESVHSKITAVREENEFNELSREDVEAAEQTFHKTLDSIESRAAEDSQIDVGFVSAGMLDAITELADSLRFSLDGIMPLVPPAPWEAEYPPERQQENPVKGPEDAVYKGLDELA